MSRLQRVYGLDPESASDLTTSAATAHAATEEGRPMDNKGEFRPDIEGLRAIAILLVLVYHAGFEAVSGGFIGVDVFFVISGFLITGSLLNELQRSEVIGLAEFYARRIRRLLPAAALTLVVTSIAIVALLPNTGWRSFGGDVGASATYWVNWRFADRSIDYLAEDVDASPVLHFWSLAVEEQFYIVWPILIGLVGQFAIRRRWSQRVAIGAAITVVVVIPSLVWSIAYTQLNPSRAFFVTTTRMWELGIGGLASVVAPRVALSPPRFTAPFKMVALATLLATSVMIDGSSTWPGAIALIPTVSTAVLLVAGGGPRDIAERFLTLRPMQAVGRLSYSLYLWHWPFVAILASKWSGLSPWQASVIIVASVVPACLSFRLVENPIRYSPRLRSSKRRTFVLAGTLTSIGVAFGIATVVAVPTTRAPVTDGSIVGAQGLNTGITDRDVLTMLSNTTSFTPAAADAVDDLPIVYEDNCPASRGRIEPIVCEYGDSGSSIHLALVGDSKIAQWASAFVDIAEAEDWRLSVLTKSSCAFSAITPIDDGAPYEECRLWSLRVVEYLERNPADLAVLSQVGSAGVEIAGLSREEALVEGMLRIYRAVEDAGSRVVLLLDNPHPGFPVYECVAENPTNLERCVFSREERLMFGGRPAQLRAAERGGYPTLDMLPKICPTETCAPVVGGILVYRQGSHLTDSYVRTMRNSLATELSTFLPVKSAQVPDGDS